MNINKKFFVENFKTIIYALLIAIFIRSIFIQPFYIPSSSMEPNLLVGDRLFVTKYSYGYSKHSFPFSPNLFIGRLFFNSPKRGDVVVFKTPVDNRTDYIKRLIGLPGDTIQIIEKDLYLNNSKINKKKSTKGTSINCGREIINVNFFEEILSNEKRFITVYREDGTMLNTDKFVVPENHYFFMGDNRDCSKDSRFLTSVGYVNFDNLVGKAQLIFFSNNKKIGSFFKFWKWNQSIRIHRFFDKIS